MEIILSTYFRADDETGVARINIKRTFARNNHWTFKLNTLLTHPNASIIRKNLYNSVGSKRVGIWARSYDMQAVTARKLYSSNCHVHTNSMNIYKLFRSIGMSSNFLYKLLHYVLTLWCWVKC